MEKFKKIISRVDTILTLILLGVLALFFTNPGKELTKSVVDVVDRVINVPNPIINEVEYSLTETKKYIDDLVQDMSDIVGYKVTQEYVGTRQDPIKDRVYYDFKVAIVALTGDIVDQIEMCVGSDDGEVYYNNGTRFMNPEAFMPEEETEQETESQTDETVYEEVEGDPPIDYDYVPEDEVIE